MKHITYIKLEDLEGSLDQILEYFTELKHKNSNKLVFIRLVDLITEHGVVQAYEVYSK